MARILICGTLAYDDIGTFDSPFGSRTRNVKLERLHQHFGGCAMNIAYNLAGLGHQSVPFVYAGDDYSGGYAHHVARHGISEAGIFRIPGTPSARGIVLTGSNGVQFTAFYPGPSGARRWQQDIDELLTGSGFDAVIVAPDLPDKMAGCAVRAGAPALRIWCPGQYAELLQRPQIEPALRACNLLVVNRHEWLALCERVPADELRGQAGRVVITDGSGPVEVQPDATTVPVPPADAAADTDPTGCGDAFVAALASALLAGAELPAAVRSGIELAGRCLHYGGAQNHPVCADAAADARPSGRKP